MTNINNLQSSGFTVNLSGHTDKFCSDSLELNIEKNVNYIFGKNGTGKTTISDEIFEQLSDDYDVYIFKDFDGVADNERLNAVSLGVKNKKIQEKINQIDLEMSSIDKEVEQPPDKNEVNLYTKQQLAKEKQNVQANKIEKFHAKSAKKIKEINDPQISITSYNKNNFCMEVGQALSLSKEQIQDYRNTIKSDKKAEIRKIDLPIIDFSNLLRTTNDIMESTVKQSESIPELNENHDKQNFARQGMRIHDQKSREKCAFCGNEISDARWEQLGRFFNDQIKEIEGKVDSTLEEIISAADKVKQIQEIDSSIYYERYLQKIRNLNSHIYEYKRECLDFLDVLRQGLNEKKEDLFGANRRLEVGLPSPVSDLDNEYENLVNEQNKLSQNLEIEQNKAKNQLRFYEIKVLLEEFNYDSEMCTLDSLKIIEAAANEELKKAKEKLKNLQNKRKNLLSGTVNEEIMAELINDALANMGVASFSLKLVVDKEDDQKGQYQIHGHQGEFREVTKVSKGEKNIIAFLYFMFSLDRPKNSNKPRIVILDDPMTSNDDTMQYLMICEIQKLSRKFNVRNSKDHLIIFTHNCHFYLNVRPPINKPYKKIVENSEAGTREKTSVSYYKKFGNFHLYSDGKKAEIKEILNGTDDFCTSYEMLWKELYFLASADGATSGLMVAPCRRICETYIKFTKISLEDFYGDNRSAKKLFDVNLHSVDDLEADTMGKSKEVILDILKQLFISNNAEAHFENYTKKWA